MDWDGLEPQVAVPSLPTNARPVRVVERDGRRLRVEGLDALDGTPVLDLEPHVDWVEQLD